MVTYTTMPPPIVHNHETPESPAFLLAATMTVITTSDGERCIRMRFPTLGVSMYLRQEVGECE